MRASLATDRINIMFRAFSDRTRLRILNLLCSGELCVCDLVRVIGSPQPTISRHLAYLRKADLVISRKQGLWMYYELAPTKNDFHKKLIECLGCCLNTVPELTKDSKKIGKPQYNNNCCK